jgi:putative ABC transport system substrate-binding protein
LQLLHELVPTASVMALLVDPTDATLAETATKEVQAAARTLGLELHVLNASTERDFDAVFAQVHFSRRRLRSADRAPRTACAGL